MAEHFGRRYAPNTRETVRRQSIHQFEAAGMILRNPDDPDRAVNSGKTVYQVSGIALGLFRSYGTAEWPAALDNYRLQVQALTSRWAKERRLRRIPVVLPDGGAITLSPGGQNVLIAALVQDFCPMFTPGGRVLYVGDADEKSAVFDQAALGALGVAIVDTARCPTLLYTMLSGDGWCSSRP